MRNVAFIDLGLKDYQKVLNYQKMLFQETVNQKIANRKATSKNKIITKDYLLFCEHSHVYTIGKSGNEKHLLVNEQFLTTKGATFCKINRGGDITYHGPGQIVVYPIIDLDYYFTDIHKYLRYLEEAVILTLSEYGMEAGRIDKLTGVWLDWENPTKARKICAFGVKSGRWVTMHGFALNVNTDLSYFNHIVPCGIVNKAVTSMQKELNKKIDIEETKAILKKKIASLFDMQLIEDDNP